MDADERGFSRKESLTQLATLALSPPPSDLCLSVFICGQNFVSFVPFCSILSAPNCVNFPHLLRRHCLFASSYGKYPLRENS